MIKQIESIVKMKMEELSREVVEVVAQYAAQQLEAMVKGELGKKSLLKHAPKASRQRRAPIAKWTADKRARRVPNFVIELTKGIDTKKKIVALYGDGAVFEKGKPAPVRLNGHQARA